MQGNFLFNLNQNLHVQVKKQFFRLQSMMNWWRQNVARCTYLQLLRLPVGKRNLIGIKHVGPMAYAMAMLQLLATFSN